MRYAGHDRYIACVPSGLSGPGGMYFSVGSRSIMLGVGVQSGPTRLRTISVYPRLVNSSLRGTEVHVASQTEAGGADHLRPLVREVSLALADRGFDLAHPDARHRRQTPAQTDTGDRSPTDHRRPRRPAGDDSLLL